MRVRDVMTTPAITVGPDTPFNDVVGQLLEHDVSGLPVVDDKGQLLGVVTEADLISKEAYGFRRRRGLNLVHDYLRGHDPRWIAKAAGRCARDIMTANPTTIGPDENLAVAAQYMLEAGHKRLPVARDGNLIGIVSRHDLLRLFDRSDEEIAADIDEAFGNALLVPEELDASRMVHDGVVTLTGTTRWPSDRTIVEAVVSRIPGVIAVDNHLTPRSPDPQIHRPSPYVG